MASLEVTIDGQSYTIEVTLTAQSGEPHTVLVNGDPVEVTLPEGAPEMRDLEWMIIGRRPYELLFGTQMQWVKAFDGLHHIEVRDLNEQTLRPRSGDGRVKAPIPGLIAQIVADVGHEVTTGDPLVVLEAMKMENEIRAPFDGVVKHVNVDIGETVVRNQVLVEIE